MAHQKLIFILFTVKKKKIGENNNMHIQLESYFIKHFSYPITMYVYGTWCIVLVNVLSCLIIYRGGAKIRSSIALLL